MSEKPPLDFERFAEAILELHFQDRRVNITPTDIWSAGEAAGLLSYWHDDKETDGTGLQDEIGYSSRYQRHMKNKREEEWRKSEEERLEREEIAPLKDKYERAE